MVTCNMEPILYHWRLCKDIQSGCHMVSPSRKLSTNNFKTFRVLLRISHLFSDRFVHEYLQPFEITFAYIFHQIKIWSAMQFYSRILLNIMHISEYILNFTIIANYFLQSSIPESNWIWLKDLKLNVAIKLN